MGAMESFLDAALPYVAGLCLVGLIYVFWNPLPIQDCDDGRENNWR